MKPEEFIKAYEVALASQDWNIVDPLMSEDVSVTFSNGTVHNGKNEVQVAFEHNFATIKSEQYSIRNVKWLMREDTCAVYLFEFYWQGIINGKSVSGSGTGTSVLVRQDGTWKLLTEHLGRKAS